MTKEVDVRQAAAALGRKGGSVSSRRKAKSSRENGKMGGRPPGEPSKLAKKLGVSRQYAWQLLQKQKTQSSKQHE
jgi:hypothetical protein